MAETIRKVVEIDIDVKSGEVKILDRELNKVLKTTKKLNSQQKAQGELQSKSERIVDRLTGGLFSQAKQWFQVGKSAVTALTGIRSGLVSTGIGALVVGLGLVVAYWDEITEYLGFANDEQEDLNNQTDSYNDKIRTQAENLDKLQLTQLSRIKAEAEANGEVITSLEAQKRLLQEKAELNAEGIEDLELLEKVSMRLNETALSQETEILDKKGEIYDFAELSAKHTTYISRKLTALEKQNLENLRNTRLEILAEIDAISKQQSDDTIAQILKEGAEREAAAKRRAARDAKYLDLKLSLEQANTLSLIENDRERQLKALEYQKINDENSIKNSEFTEAQKFALKTEYLEKFQIKKAELEEQFAAEDLASAITNQDLFESIGLQIMEDGIDKELQINGAKYDALYAQAEGNAELQKQITKRQEIDAQVIVDKHVENQKAADEQIRQDKILATQASLDVAARATTSLMMMNDALVDHGLITAKKGFQIAKGVAIAEATISTANAAISAYKSVVGVPYVGPILAPIAAGVAVAAGGAQIAMISAQTFDGGGGGAVSSPSAGGAGAPGLGAPQFNTVGQSGFNQVAGSIADQNQGPIKAYVVANDVTSQQSLDRNNRDKSSF
tara:strand:- start:1259 stop:3112 length:1854 start_codon:yes stop_codon:yes gene_type:complete